MSERNEILDTRDVTAAFHFKEGRKWLALSQKGNRTTPLVYCAFEFRLSLERVAFELLRQIRNSSFDESDLKAATRLKNIQRIHELEGNQLQLDRKFAFLNLLLELAGNKRLRLAKINLSVLQKHWHFCSNHCHMYLTLHTSWRDKMFVDAAYSNLGKVREFLGEISESLILWGRLEDDPWIKGLQDDFVAGGIDETSVASEIQKKGVWGLY